MSSIDKPPVSIRIRLKYPDVETFVEKYATNISRGGMFIQSRVPQPVGTALRFEVLLQDDTPLLRGGGTVIWIKEYDAAHPTQVHGMGIRFSELDEASQAMLEHVLAAKSRPARPRSETQEVRALVREAHAAEPHEAPQIDEGSQRRAAPAIFEEEEDDSGATMVQPFAALEGSSSAARETTQREPIPGEPEAAPPPQPPFASLVAETAPVPAAPRGEEPAAPRGSVEPAPPATSAEELAALANALEAGGDGVAVALAMAEQVLGELCAAAGIGEDRILAVAASARELGAITTAGPGDELESLLAPAPLPAASFAEAQAELAARGVAFHAPSVAPAPARPAPASTEVRHAPASGHAPVAPAPGAPLAPVATLPLLPEEAAAEPDEPPFDPTLLQAAARTARAAKQERSTGSFDLSDGRGATGEFVLGERTPPATAPATAPSPAAPPASPPEDPGWRRLQTVTELLDHGSSQVLQDMAQLAGRKELEVRDGSEEVSFVEPADDTPAERAAESAAPGEEAPAEEPLAEAPSAEAPLAEAPAEEPSAEPLLAEEPLAEPLAEESLEEPLAEPLAARPVAGEPFAAELHEEASEGARLEPEEAATEPFLDSASVDELSREIWKEVVDEAAEELDRLEMPDEPANFFPADEETADPDQLTAPVSEGGDDLYADEDLSESTQVTAMPFFADRAPASSVGEPRSPAPRASDRSAREPEGFQPEREPDELATLEPDHEVDLEGVESADGEDTLPPDPDLSSEVFETLAGLRDTLRERPGPAPVEPAPRERGPLDPDTIPSLEDLAGPRAAPPAPSAPEPIEPESVAVHPTDPDAPAPKKIKPARSGIFSRIFRKK